MSKKYLYGASVQGIQDFIFKTNKLAEIVGASELVEQICTEKFIELSNLKKDDSSILQMAAGNVKCEFSDEVKLKDVVSNFPMEVQKMAPGITISQAVVEIEGDDYLQKLEDKLKVQRNKIAKPLEIGFMGLERDRRTGEVAYTTRKKRDEDKQDELISESSLKKLDLQKHTKLFSKISGIEANDLNIDKDLALDISEISASGKNSWIAVIHADGNGLGKILQGKGKEISEKGQNRAFSLAIENTTKSAVRKAFKEVVSNDKEKWEKPDKFKYPIRPVVLGGDDLTVIIRADLALEFTHLFLAYFEEFSEDEFKINDDKTNLEQFNLGKLTACAGIAYVKDSYPLHYALHLAEELCKDAKKKVQGLASGETSALAFHKVQDSFITDFKELKKRTLLPDTKVWDFYFGPYLLDDVDNLKKKLGLIEQEANSGDRKTKAVGKLRQIVSESYKDKTTTQFMLERMKDVNEKFFEKLQLGHELENIKSEGTSKSILLDLITLHSFNYGDKNN